MKDRINRLAKGIVDLDIPQLQLSQETFEGVVTAGEVSRAELVLSSANGVHLKGLFYSDHPKIKVLKNAFGGVKTRIAFEIDARHLRDADQLKGNFYLVSNAGERKIPYSFCVRSYASAEIIATLHTPHDFARLLLDEEEMALRVFVYDDFIHAPFMDNGRVRTIYEGLKQSVDRRCGVLEFLRALKAAPKLEELPLGQKGAGLQEKRQEMQESQRRPEELYLERLEDVVLIEEIATMMIREGDTSANAFVIYQKAIEHDSKITRLYEYYLYALPEDFVGRMPREVYLYFAYENNIQPNAMLPLYYNVLQNFSQDSDIYQKFEREIRNYAIEHLLSSHINSKLALIYDKMIYSDMIDGRIASVLPAILKSYRVATKDPRMAYVVVRYEELTAEEVFPLKNGCAYVPLFFENNVILFQDAYGNRYAEVAYSKAPVMHKPLLEKRCFEIYPEHPMLKLSAARRIASNGIQNENQLRLIEEVLEQMRLNQPYAERLVHGILEYHDKFTKTKDENVTERDFVFLKGLDQRRLSMEERGSVIKTLVKLGAYEDAYQMAVEFGVLELERTYMERLLRHIIQKVAYEAEETLLMYAKHLFEHGSKDGTLLRYLCENYNGLSSDMLRILKRSTDQELGRHAMTERLLAQMIFSRTNQELDYVYQQYWQQDDCEPVLIHAYITQKCIDYFVGQKQTGEAVFSQLYQILSEQKEKEKIPTIYLLALSRYYAEQKTLKQEQKQLLSDTIDSLLEQKLIFAYTRKLARFIHLPDYVMDKVYIEYHGSRDEKPTLLVRVLPDEDEYHEEDMPRVYQNIYVKPMVLFAGEKADYQIYEGAAPEGSPQVSGQISMTEVFVKATGDTYDILNEMSRLMNTDQEAELKESMLKYVRNQSVIDVLFSEIKG